MVNAMRMMKYAFMAMAAMLLATPAFAQAAGEATSPWTPIGAGIGMALAAGLWAGSGSGNGFGFRGAGA